MLLYVAGIFMFTLECYHALAHCMIMFGIRTLPRRDLVKIRYYFFLDALSVFISSFLLTGWWKWLGALHIAQHAFYFFTWDKSYMAKRIIDWSSLDWFRHNTSSQLDSFFGTAFDVVVHIAMMYAISQMLNATGIIVAIVLAQAMLFAVVFNPKFAWSSPKSTPQWVQKRLGKLSQEYD